MIKKKRLIVLFTSDVRCVCGLHATRFVAKIYLGLTCKLSKLVEHKKSGLIFYFGFPFRQRNGMCKLAAAEDYRVFHKIIFRGCPIIHSFSNRVVGETLN